MNWIYKIATIELRRIWRAFMILLLGVASIELGGFMLFMINKKVEISEMLAAENMSMKTYLENGFIESFGNYLNGFGGMMTFSCIVAGLLSLLIYGALIWYRDYMSSSKTIIAYFTLPISRYSILLGKAVTIVSLAVCFGSFQLVLIAIQNGLYTLVMGIDVAPYQSLSSILLENKITRVFFPFHLLDFFFLFLIGVAVLFVVFAIVLLERGFGKIGLLYGAIYIMILVGMMIFFVREDGRLQEFEAIVQLVVTLISSYSISHYLIMKKIGL